MLACHAGGRGFESRPLRHRSKQKARSDAGFLLFRPLPRSCRIAGKLRG